MHENDVKNSVTPEVKNQEKQYLCQYCDKVFGHQSNRIKHVRAVHLGVKYKCQLCDRKFTQLSVLRAHLQEDHQGNKSPESSSATQDSRLLQKKRVKCAYRYQCNKCEKNYSNFHSLNWHVKIQHEGLKLKCQFCVSYFSHQTTLIKHIESKHKDAEKKLQETKLVRVDEGDDSQLFQCDFDNCHQDFVKENNLLIHAGQAHPESSIKQCGKCGQKCGSPSALKKHYAAIHENTKKRCSICKKKISIAYYALHVKTIHEGLKRICEFCQNPISYNNLKKHSRICRKKMKKIQKEMKVCPYCRESVASKKMNLHIESHYFQSDMFQPIVCLQNLSESEIQGLRTLELFKRLKIEDEKVITEEVQEVSEEPTRLTMEHFKSPMFQPTVRLSNLSKSEVQILQALELFRQFKRPF